MEDNLRIVNMTVSGKMPFTSKMKLEEVHRLIEKGKLGWDIKDETHGILSFYTEKEGKNSRGENKTGYTSMWSTGTITISGITKEEEADEIYKKVLKEIKRLCPRVMKNE
jgi:hypothetical protein